jgi:hypothetical protein
MLAPSEKREQLLGRIGLGICMMATVIAVCLHVVYLTHAGALWRDEASGVQLVNSTDPSLRWWPAHDAFPVFFFALVRVWSALGLDATDFTLRILGFLIGLGVLGAIWLNARLLGLRWPFISLGLLAANLALVRWGDSLRAYGCGCLFIMLALGLVWKLVRTPGRSSFLTASLAAILSVQTLYQNAFLVLAACLAGCAVCARHRQWKTAALVLSVGLLAAVSLVPYVPLLVHSQDYNALFKMGFQPDRVWATLAFALGADLKWPLWGWFGLAPLVLGAGWAALLEQGKGSPVGFQDLPVFAVSALVAGIALFFAFLRLSEFPTQPWYFLPLMAFAASAMDGALANWCRQFRAWAAVFVAVMVCVAFPAILKLARYRQTNIDLIAAELHRQSKPGDLILVSPFFFGITFDRYFRGPAAWTTLPPIDDLRFHRIDLLRTGLCSKPLLQSVLDRVARTLTSGHTLWMVGDWPPPQPGESAPPDLPDPPPPGQPFGFAESSLCTYVWERQTVYLIATHAEHAAAVPVQPATPVSEVENVRLIRANGWRGGSGTTPAPP